MHQILSLKNISLDFGISKVLDDITFSILDKEKICLVGRNGTGKSTLLKLLLKQVEPDSGEVIFKENLRIGYLEQDVPKNLSGTIREVVSKGLGKTGQAIFEYQSLLDAKERDKPYDGNRISCLQNEIDEKSGWIELNKINKIVSKLFLDLDQDINELSGGLKKRVLLARAIVKDPDLLILDEPTNHLDLESISWLESFLRDQHITQIFVTHDRTFLNSIATKILELDRGKLFEYPGEYKKFLELKEKRWIDDENKIKSFNKILAKEEAWIRQGVKARRKRNEGRVKELKKLRVLKNKIQPSQKKTNMVLDSSDLSGKLVIEAKNISYSHDDNTPVFSNFSVRIQRGDRIAIIGKNGVGKTTLLNVLIGNIHPNVGTVKLGTKLKISFFDQMRNSLKEDESLINNLSDGTDFLHINGKDKHITSYLQDYLFPISKIRNPIKMLSGGEKSRLLLAKLFSKSTNLLVLDEPTNDLDIETLELLEEKLQTFDGTVLIISHDRYFLDNIATHTIAFEKEKPTLYVGGYSDWERQKTIHSKEKIAPNKNSDRTLQKKQNNKLSYKEKEKLNSITDEISNMESQLKQFYEALNNGDLFKTKFTEALEYKKKISAVEKMLEETYLEWERLEQKKDSK